MSESPSPPNSPSEARHAPGDRVDLDRARGALLGLCVGDALGTTLEFTRPPPAPFSPPLRGPHREILGGGPFGVAPGQVTDDTQMAACLAASLAASGRLDPVDLAARYVAWSHHAFDIGNQTRDALAAVERGSAADEAGRDVWLRSGRRAAGNGSLMRTAPIGVFFAARAEDRRADSLIDSAITHFDPRCRIACAAFNAAVAAAARDRASPAAMTDAARGEIAEARASLVDELPDERALIDGAAADLAADLDAASADDPMLYGPALHLHDHAGFVRVAFRLAFFQLGHAGSFEAALVDVVNRGGDADTNGAITGALVGARFGESGIPLRWRQATLAALDGGTDPLATLYHPRTLLSPWPATGP